MPSAEVVARYFLYLASSVEEAVPMTHLQLQKLLYYAQGWSLAFHGRPLFDATIEAWRHGPVVRGVFPKFADHGSDPIPWGEARSDGSLSVEDRSLIEYVWRGYGRYSPWHLRDMTHQEPPWRDARVGMPHDAAGRAPITHEALRRFFRGLHEASARRQGIDPARLEQGLRDAREGRTVPFEQLVAEARRGLAH